MSILLREYGKNKELHAPCYVSVNENARNRHRRGGMVTEDPTSEVEDVQQTQSAASR
jgi:hypothetical protein